MPFQTTAIAPGLNPKVTVVFSGLLVFRPGANNTCEVGVHRFTRDHITQVLLMVNKPHNVAGTLGNKPPMPIPVLRGPLTADFSIRLIRGGNPNPEPSDFAAFAPTPEPFDRAFAGNNECDYRWAVNFKDPNIHPNVNINAGAQPLVKLSTGVLFTPHLTRPGIGPRLMRPAGTVDLNRIAATMAVAIDPPAGTNVVLDWSDLGVPDTRTLPRQIDSNEPGTTYTLFVINDPPSLTAEFHDEMLHYYKVLEDQNTHTLFTGNNCFKFDCAAVPQQKTDEVPCLIGRLEP
jgi:hypothetical protein